MSNNSIENDLIPCEICNRNIPFSEYSDHIAMCSYRNYSLEDAEIDNVIPNNENIEEVETDNTIQNNENIEEVEKIIQYQMM